MPTAPAAAPHASPLVIAWRWVFALGVGYALLWIILPGHELGLSRYLPLHTTMETAAIVISMLAFGIAWNAYADSRPGNVVIVGAVFFGVGLLDFAHTLSYHGMPDFVTPSSPQKGIAFWLAARYLAAFGLLAIALRAWRPLLNPKLRYWLLVAVIGYVVMVYRMVLIHPDLLPDFFVTEHGLTPIKLILEYILIALYGTAAVLFHRRARRGGNRFNAADLFAAAAIAAISELCFTLYSSISDLFNTVGHIYKIVSYGFIYRAVFVDSVRQPFLALNTKLAKEKEWAAEQHSFVRTLDMLDEAVLEVIPDGRIANANGGWWRLAGTDPVVGFPMSESVHAEDRDAFTLRLMELMDGTKDEFRGRFRFHAEGRPEQWMEVRFVAERDEDGQTRSARGVLRDITKTYMQERHITHMALHDALTNLPNRVLLEDRIQKAIQLAARSGRHVAVCFIDLDHFKDINDAYGHKTGDALLLKLASLLKASLREGDTLARWGGDEFVVLLPELVAIDAVRQVADKLVAVMREVFELDDIAVSLTFSMGIALYPDDSNDVEGLLAQADRAMFYAKSQGRNNYQLYADMSSKGLGKKELYIQSRLAQAIREERITVWFQPLIAAHGAGHNTPPLAGIEALARWHDPDLGWISPGSFIPMAENLGLIGELGQLVRRQALEHFSRWRQQHPDLHLALNISKRQLFGPDFVDELQADAKRYGIPHDALILEVTESVALMDVEFAEDRLRQLSGAGFMLSIDDFGTGYASLSQLHELPVGELKIDISFIRRVNTAEGLRMVQAIVNLAQALSLRTVAEGIEDNGTATLLRDLGVDLLQGYHFGKPCPAAEFESGPLFANVVARDAVVSHDAAAAVASAGHLRPDGLPVPPAPTFSPQTAQ